METNVIVFKEKDYYYNGLPVAFIDLSCGFVAMIDKRNEELAYELSNSYHLNELHKSEYARGVDEWGQKFYLSRAIMNCNDPAKEVDYLDGNTMNLTEANLYICTHKENAEIKKARELAWSQGLSFPIVNRG